MDSVADPPERPPPCAYCTQADPLTLGRGADTTVYCGNCGTLVTPPARARLPDDQLPCTKCHRRTATDRVPLAAGNAAYCRYCAYVVRRAAWQETVRRYAARYGSFDPTPPDRAARRRPRGYRRDHPTWVAAARARLRDAYRATVDPGTGAAAPAAVAVQYGIRSTDAPRQLRRVLTDCGWTWEQLRAAATGGGP
jgi:hypothetical protein